MTSHAKKSLVSGKPAFKFKFTVTLEYLELRLKKDWKPKNLQIVWSRGQRHRVFTVSKELIEYRTNVSDSIEYEVGNVNWERGTSSALLVTLYKSSEDAEKFLKKEYVFSLEDNRGLTRRKLAIFPLNIADYASLEPDSTPLEMEFKTLSNKTMAVTAGLHVNCQFVKKGTSNDDDMISNFSHVSDYEAEYRRMTMSLDEENNGVFEFRCPLQQPHSNVAILQGRAQQTKSQLLLDLNIAEKSDIRHLRPADSPNLTPKSDENGVSSSDGEQGSGTKKNNRSLPDIPIPDYSPEVSIPERKKRHRLSAVNLDAVTPPPTPVDRKTSKGNILATLRSGVRAVLHGRKGSLNSDSDMDAIPDMLKSATLPVSPTSPFSKITDNDDSKRIALQLLHLEAKNQELLLQCGSLEDENTMLRREKEDLQMEVGELQLLVEELRSRLIHAEADRQDNTTEKEKFFEKLDLKGWLCKRGVKGGPIGKRWQRRWFSISREGYLYYYKSNDNNIPRGFIALDLILAVEDVFPPHQDKNNGSFNVITDGRVYELMAYDQEEKEKWINALDFIRSWRSQMYNISL
ncbi:EH domain-binding protein 1-like protein 1 isoform X2 [Rhopilema esculentum]|uniref:EH domain-binding protein 1-like protein 1 isoform X2 n=1 Tax=Rhopilema esculentum TaxID=499914 RepID=UPI0031D783EF